MTREETIETLGHVVPFATQNGEKIAEAIDMAIKALANLKEEFESADAVIQECRTHGRLIDADELKKHLDGAWEELNDDGERKGVRLARWYLISAPTVDSTIDVVRCKDCRHAGECHKSVQYTRNEPNTVTIGYTKIDFCSHGERREE